MKQLLDHIRLGVCVWDVAGIVAIALVSFFMGRRINRAKEHRCELETKLMGDSVNETIHIG